MQKQRGRESLEDARDSQPLLGGVLQDSLSLALEEEEGRAPTCQNFRKTTAYRYPKVFSLVNFSLSIRSQWQGK